MNDDGHLPPDQVRTGGLFPATRWTVVRQLTNGERRIRFPAWEEFVVAYRRPLECWLLARCRDPHHAEELVQSFLAKMCARDHLLESLDPSKGRLRSWLLVCLKRHWLDHLPDPPVPLPDDYGDTGGESDEDYDQAWARSLAQRALQQLRSEYQTRGRGELFEALLGIIDGAPIEERAALHERFQMARNAFDKALERLRDRISLRLRDEVAATLLEDDATLVDQELRHLILTLGRNGGLDQNKTNPPI